MLFLIILMLLAVQYAQYSSTALLIALGLFVLLVFTAKSKLFLLAAIIGGILVVFFYFGSDYRSWIVLGGLFIVLLAIVKASPPEPGPETYAPGYGGMGAGGMY